jgi:PmbA protein
MARLTSEDESSGLPPADAFPESIPDLQLADSAWDDLTPAQRIDLARRAEAAAMSADARIKNSDGGGFEYERSQTVLANTHGVAGGYEATAGSLAAVPVALSESGMQRDYWVSVARHRNRLESPEDVGRRSAQRVLRRLGARKVKTCEVPVVFDPMTARTLIGHVFAAVSGDAIYRRSSFLVDQLGQNVAAAQVAIVDDGRMPSGLGSRPFDDEGIATGTTPVVEAGALCNYLHSAYSARKTGARPTGNGSRTGAGTVGVGPNNFYLKPGSFTPEELIASVKSGLYVVELIGSGVNTVNGDYSRGVAGIWIENGALAFPVHEVTIAGNLRQMLKDIEMIGSDITFLGSIASPSLKLRRMVISGE